MLRGQQFLGKDLAVAIGIDISEPKAWLWETVGITEAEVRAETMQRLHMNPKSGPQGDPCQAVWHKHRGPTFKTAASRCTGRPSRSTVPPELSSSFSSLRAFSLAAFLKTPSVEGPLRQRTARMSYGRQGRGQEGVR